VGERAGERSSACLKISCVACDGRCHLDSFVPEHPPAARGRRPRPIPCPHAARACARPAPNAAVLARAGPLAHVARFVQREARVAATRNTTPPTGGAQVGVAAYDARPARSRIRAVEGRVGGMRGRTVGECRLAVEGVVGAAAALDARAGQRGGCRMCALGGRGCLRPTTRPSRAD
jgi:hypothetical protein